MCEFTVAQIPSSRAVKKNVQYSKLKPYTVIVLVHGSATSSLRELVVPSKAPFTLCWQLARNVVANDGCGGLPPHFYHHNFLLNQVCTMYRRYSQ